MASRGTFVLADIGGYTSFLSGVAIEHGTEITEDLLNTLLRCNRNRWKLANVEGDCIFFYTEGSEPPDELVDHISEMYGDFCRRAIDIAERAACPCGACARTGELTLKFIVHAGEFETQRIANRTELVGSDVITAHRLLKNSVSLEEYVLLTDAYARDMIAGDLPEGRGEDEYEHCGKIEYSVLDLEPVRAAVRQSNRTFVAPEQARIVVELQINAPPDDVWEALTKPEERLKWEDLRESQVLPGPRAGADDVHRCVFPDGTALVQVPVAVEMDQRKKTERWHFTKLVKNVLVTLAVGDSGDGTCRFGCYMTYEPAIPVVSHFIEPMFRRTAKKEIRKSFEHLKTYCERRAGPPA